MSTVAGLVDEVDRVGRQRRPGSSRSGQAPSFNSGVGPGMIGRRQAGNVHRRADDLAHPVRLRTCPARRPGPRPPSSVRLSAASTAASSTYSGASCCPPMFVSGTAGRCRAKPTNRLSDTSRGPKIQVGRMIVQVMPESANGGLRAPLRAVPMPLRVRPPHRLRTRREVARPRPRALPRRAVRSRPHRPRRRSGGATATPSAGS